MDVGDAAFLSQSGRVCEPDGNRPADDQVASDPYRCEGIVLTARAAFLKWDALGGIRRATILEAIAKRHEEGSDFARACIYYARWARSLFGRSEPMPGPAGEETRLSRQGLGIVACGYDGTRSLRDFSVRIIEVLAAGNAVIAFTVGVDNIAAKEHCAAFVAPSMPTGLIQWVSAADARSLIRTETRIAGISWIGESRIPMGIQAELAGQAREIVRICVTEQTKVDRLRFAIEKTVTTNTMAAGGNAELLSLSDPIN